MVTPMKLSIFNLSILLLLALPFSAQANRPDSVNVVKYEHQLERYRENWARLIPQYSKVQFAGGMGMFSFGVGWDYGRKEQWETDLMFGFVPKFSNNKTNWIVTLKQNYIPWRLFNDKKFSFEPFETGLSINKVAADNFWGKEPSKYNGPYYRFATAIRFNFFVGQRVQIKLSKKKLHKSITFYYEVGTNDLYLVSLFTNKYLSLTDIVSVSFGAKFKVF